MCPNRTGSQGQSHTCGPGATPLTIGAFFLMSATGVLMFFGWDRGLTSGVHEWFSWLFLAGAARHIAANIRPFMNHLRSGWGKASITMFIIAMAASFLSWGIETGDPLRRDVERALVDAPLSTLASLTNATPEDLRRRLEARGIIADGR